MLDHPIDLFRRGYAVSHQRERFAKERELEPVEDVTGNIAREAYWGFAERTTKAQARVDAFRRGRGARHHFDGRHQVRRIGEMSDDETLGWTMFAASSASGCSRLAGEQRVVAYPRFGVGVKRLLGGEILGNRLHHDVGAAHTEAEVGLEAQPVKSPAGSFATARARARRRRDRLRAFAASSAATRAISVVS